MSPMAAIINKNLFLVLSLSLIIGLGHCQCSLKQIAITQTDTGATIHNKPEWKVTIHNVCSCAVLHLKLACSGFQTVEDIDPSVLSISNGECLVNNGQPIYPSNTYSFTYAWDTSFPFKPVYSEVACS
ncbi:TPD1 protein homolog 1-like [Juglans microcarpa x Juglans regia]|uniref:TPD1 protein homolog 1-like n=1 Tax=Juglans microcarpa x Juglans regia TaxID=2249226 RepID=UPI001B7E4836|nr:TPD1 protein homolog 1-like [Juglans microcarpa x Juglans regia]